MIGNFANPRGRHRQLNNQNETAVRLYRSLRAVKVLLAALRSTLTVLAPRIGRSLSVCVGDHLLIFIHDEFKIGADKLPVTKRDKLRPVSCPLVIDSILTSGGESVRKPLVAEQLAKNERSQNFRSRRVRIPLGSPKSASRHFVQPFHGVRSGGHLAPEW